MPRYFFHIHDGQDLLDTEGILLPNDADAKQEAMRAGAEFIGEMGDRLWQGLPWRMDVIEAGRHVGTLHFRGRFEEH